MVQSCLSRRLDPRFREDDSYRLSNWLKQAPSTPHPLDEGTCSARWFVAFRPSPKFLSEVTFRWRSSAYYRIESMRHGRA